MARFGGVGHASEIFAAQVNVTHFGADRGSDVGGGFKPLSPGDAVVLGRPGCDGRLGRRRISLEANPDQDTGQKSERGQCISCDEAAAASARVGENRLRIGHVFIRP